MLKKTKKFYLRSTINQKYFAIFMSREDLFIQRNQVINKRENSYSFKPINAIEMPTALGALGRRL